MPALAHNTAMKCGNRGCDYELYSFEADFLICPGCGEPVLLDRVRSVSCDRRLHTPANRVMDRVKKLRFWGFFAYALAASASVAWYLGGPDALTSHLRPQGGDIFLEATPYFLAFMMVGLGIKQFVPQTRLWVDDPNWTANTKAQLLIRTAPYVIWALATLVFWSYPSVSNLQAALAANPTVANAHPQLVMASTLGAYLAPLMGAGVGLFCESLEVISQRHIARINALLMRKPEAFPILHEDADPTDLDPQNPSQSNLTSR